VAKGYVTMSQREVGRLEVIRSVATRQLRQADAAQQLGLSIRQVKRLVQRYRRSGAAGLVSGHRGKRPNNAIADETRQAIMALVRSRYADFGPTLACEKLQACHQYTVSSETLRQWMIAEGLWQPKRRKQARIHQRRPRRPCRGELVQIDGSPHDWLEERGPRCTLIVFIDDATSQLLALRLVPAETTRAYMETLSAYLAQHGRPVALYSDKHSIFRVNHPDHEGELTQFSRALRTLDIEAIHANSPQAKGRVERANQTLQDRLVKELRLQGIDNLEAANVFLPTFMAQYNTRFAVAPQNTVDAHRTLLHSPDELALILCLHHTRKLSKNLTFQFHNREYQIQTEGQGYRLRRAAVTVCEAFDGSVSVIHQGKPLAYRLLAEGQPPTPLDDEKSVHHRVEQAKARQAEQPRYKPALDHPWRRRAISDTSSAAT
jgi:transposase